MESRPQNPEFRNNPENFHPCKRDFFRANHIQGSEGMIVRHAPIDRMQT